MFYKYSKGIIGYIGNFSIEFILFIFLEVIFCQEFIYFFMVW